MFFNIFNLKKNQKKDKEKNKKTLPGSLKVPNDLPPEKIEGQNIICLDIDGAIVPSMDMLISSEETIKNTFYTIVQKNVQNIKEFCIEDNFQIFIISSWSEFLDIDIENKRYVLTENRKGNFTYVNTVFKLIQPLAEFTIGMSPYGDREEDIKILGNQNNKVIIIDDIDLSFLENENVKYFKIHTMNYFNYIMPIIEKKELKLLLDKFYN